VDELSISSSVVPLQRQASAYLIARFDATIRKDGKDGSCRIAVVNVFFIFYFWFGKRSGVQFSWAPLPTERKGDTHRRRGPGDWDRTSGL
jgi:hypothetical protein